jgi:Archaeal phage integrase
MSRLLDDGDDSSSNIRSGGARGFESDSAIINWQQFHNFLLQRMTAKTAEDRLSYAKQYHSLLQNGDIQSLLSASPNKRIHIMKSLSSLARFTGNTDLWRQMRQRHGLAWSTGTEKIDAFTRFFDDSKSLDTMLQWLREATRILPNQYANLFLFCTLTGLRASEAIESIRLLNIDADTHRSYYNPKQNVLQHYRFPDTFIRRTKAVYISVVDKDIIRIAQSIEKTPTLNALKMVTRHRCLSMKIKYCRKIYASYLHKCGISSDLIDMLQGRIGKNIFLKHYLTPTGDYKDRVLDALKKLKHEVDS